MHIAVFGGSQGIGRSVIQQALAQGHSVAALLRNPAKIDLAHPNLTIVAGDVLDATPVGQVVTGAAVVINTLGGTANNPDDICTQGTRRILAAMQQQGVRRLVTVTALGVGDSYDKVPLAFKAIIKTALRKAYADKESQERLIMASDRDWIIVRPGGLSDDPASGAYQVGDEVRAGRVSRADVAAFLLTQLSDDAYLRRAVGIS